MSIETTPPAKPPRVSPDGNWVWDGTKWQPNVAAMPWEGADATTIVPDAGVAKIAAVVQRAVAVYSPPAAEPAAANFVYPVTEAPVTPLWVEAPRAGKRPYLYFVGGLVVLVIAGVILNTLGINQLPWPGSASTSTSRPTPAPSMPPLTVRSDSARADRFLNLTLAPALVALSQTGPALNASCYGTLSNGCFDAINTTDKQVKKVLAVIDRGDIPSCIAAGMSRLHGDIAAMDASLAFALKAYADNITSELVQGLSKFASVGQPLATDAQSVNRAQKTQCSTQLTGP